jgi:hypothetical protein
VRKDTGPVAVVRRGVLGGAFFCFALVVMVMLVSWVNRHTVAETNASLSSSAGGASGRTTGRSDGAAVRPSPTAVPVPVPVPRVTTAAAVDPFGANATSTTNATSTPNAASTTAVDSGLTLIAFDGIPASLVVRGTVRIQLVVQGDTGPIRFLLRSSAARTTMETVSTVQPFVFTPRADGWDTTTVPNGVYTLTAETLNNSANPLTAQIDVNN